MVLLLVYGTTNAQQPAVREDAFTKFASRQNNPVNSYEVCRFKPGSISPLQTVRILDDSTAILSRNQLIQIKTGIFISAPANDRWKFSPAAEASPGTKPGEYTIIVTDPANMIPLLEKLEGLRITGTDALSNAVMVECKPAVLLHKIAPLPAVIFIDLKQKAQTEIGIIGYDRSYHGINAVDYLIPGANGKNRAVGVKEQQMQVADLDIYKRVLPSSIAASSTDNHATVIASIIGGAGNSFYDGRGIANGCSFFPSSFSNLFADDITVLNANNVAVENHSYGTVIQQFYGAEAVSYDAQTWLNKNMLHVFSAGNRGSQFATDGKYANITGFANLTGNFKMAKNIITVGAIDNKGIVGAESSAGPLYDGRIAPQLTALGPNGTSDAAAAVSGTIAVLQQVYADSNGQALPAAALIKAVLYNTADDIYTKGIDYKTGYGLLNSYAAVKTIQQKKYDGGSLAAAQSWIKNMVVPANIAQLKVTLAWTDTSSAVNNNKALLNDLDLEIIETGSGTVYKPWVLNAAAQADSLVKPATRKRDSLNTAEQVSIQLPAAGNYQVKVTGTSVQSATVPFAIAVNADTLNTFSFTNPQHASDANREENPDIVIKWKTFVADTNTTGNLFISYNNGSSWQLIKSALKIYSNQYSWAIKDTASTALFKMETPFGSFFSASIILSKVTRPVVDYVCADSFRLSWKKHVYAGGYKIFTLADSAYLKPILTVTDTFAVFKRNNYPNLVYAVEPILTNNLPAIRSLAFDITLQGVQCFYKTLYYNLLDQNKLDLVLELSNAALTDSVSFEQVTGNGQLIKIYGSQKTLAATNIYHQLTEMLDAGITYIRARIRLQNGVSVYTDIIQVLTTGSGKIRFYPNPVSRGEQLHYVLQQGLPADSRLQLFDISGRMVRNMASLPNSINISTLSPGMYIYKLMQQDRTVIETGKLFIR